MLVLRGEDVYILAEGCGQKSQRGVPLIDDRCYRKGTGIIDPRDEGFRGHIPLS